MGDFVREWRVWEVEKGALELCAAGNDRLKLSVYSLADCMVVYTGEIQQYLFQ